MRNFAAEAGKRKSIFVPLQMMQTIRVEKNLHKMGNRLPEAHYKEIKK